jgi:alkylation response protein AidB-like acyl-CoA dehydrogenase
MNFDILNGGKMSLINLNNEQKMIQDEFRRFAKNELEQIAEELEENAIFPKKLIDKIADLGLLSLIIPEQYGGVELDLTSMCIAVEELSKISASVGSVLVTNNCLVAYPIMKYGSKEQKEKYLNSLSEGAVGGYLCQTQTDLPEEQNSYSEDGKSFTGIRELGLNAEAADFFVMPDFVSGQLLLLEKSDDTLELQNQQVMGLKSSGIKKCDFSNAKLESVTKTENNEFLEPAYIGMSAISLGISEACLDAATAYSKERIQFGHSISEYPMVRAMLTEMKIKIDAVKLMIYDAADRFDKGEDISVISRQAKVLSGDVAEFCGLTSIQVHGGYGYMKDYPIERYFRDAKVLQLLETNPMKLKDEIALKMLK